VDDFDGDTFRVVYAVRFKSAVYVLHCFQKKSKKGAETPKADMTLWWRGCVLLSAMNESEGRHEKDASRIGQRQRVRRHRE